MKPSIQFLCPLPLKCKQVRRIHLTLSHYRINPNQLKRSLFQPFSNYIKTKTKEHPETLPVTINLILLLITAYCRTKYKLLFVETRSQLCFSNFLTLFPFSVNLTLSSSLPLSYLFPQFTFTFYIYQSSQHHGGHFIQSLDSTTQD